MDRYVIFRGLPEMMPFQLGMTADLARAIDLMNRMNDRIPGDYFIRDVTTREVVHSVHSSVSENISVSFRPPEKEGSFDIFCGIAEKSARWYETVEGLANARIRMEQIAHTAPGAYFVFCRRDRSVVARIDTTKAADRAGLDSAVA